jgi:hypothetical protein
VPAGGAERLGPGGYIIVAPARLSNWPNDLTLAAFCVLSSASYLALETYACFWFLDQPEPGVPRQVQNQDRKPRRPADHYGEPILGFRLIGKSIYLIVS